MTLQVANHVAGLWAQWMLHLSWQVALLAVLVFAVSAIARKSSAAFRHSLWLLVFFRLILPPDLASPWSANSLLENGFSRSINTPIEKAADNLMGGMAAPSMQPRERHSATVSSNQVSPALIGMIIWLAISLSMIAGLMVRYRWYLKSVMQGCVPVPEHIRALVLGKAQQLDLSAPPCVLAGGSVKIPTVVGFVRTTILLPQTLLDELAQEQLANLIGHELAHVRRHDIQVGWFISIVLCVYWFNPVVWLSNFFIRREREMACDDAVLYATRQEGKEYAATVVRMAESFDHTVPVGAGFLGLLELSDNLLLRIRSCLDGTRARRFTWQAAVVLCVFAALFVPMGAWAPSASADNGPADTAPVIVSSTPVCGATDVDPNLDRIVVTFDQDMAGGFSWTGGKEFYFPQTTGKPAWRDKRTCELPIELEPGSYYRVGINSSSHQNFKSTDGIPVPPQAIVFTTRGADAALVKALTAPKVVSLAPENNGTDVDSTVNRLIVEFDQPMGGGFSWVQEDAALYPETTGKPEWSADKKTCTLPVKLKANQQYRIWLNQVGYNNFQNDHGVELEPVLWEFTTK